MKAPSRAREAWHSLSHQGWRRADIGISLTVMMKASSLFRGCFAITVCGVGEGVDLYILGVIQLLHL